MYSLLISNKDFDAEDRVVNVRRTCCENGVQTITNLSKVIQLSAQVALSATCSDFIPSFPIWS